jgi:hypothetical protein
MKYFHQKYAQNKGILVSLKETIFLVFFFFGCNCAILFATTALNITKNHSRAIGQEIKPCHWLQKNKWAVGPESFCSVFPSDRVLDFSLASACLFLQLKPKCCK